MIPPRMDAPGPPPRELPRLLGAWSAASIVIGCVIGSGVFMKPQVLAQNLPSPGWILVCWAISGLLALIGSLAFAEMSGMYPQAGGQYVYLRESFGRLPAFLFGWTNLTIINAASIAALAYISVEYFFNILGIAIDKESPFLYKAIAVGFIALLTAANAVGVLWGARIQNLLTAFKLLALAAIIGGMLLPGRAHPENLSPFWTIRGGSEAGVMAGFKEAFLAIFWAYDGWYLLSFSGGEIREPRRNIPLGFTLGILVVIGAYVLANLSFLLAIPLADMAVVGKDVTGGVGALAARHYYGAVGLSMISVGILGSTLGALNGNILTGPRLFYAMARDGLFFRPFAGVHPRFLTPFLSIVVQGALSTVCIFLGNFDDLTDSVVFAAWIFYGLTIVGLFKLRRANAGKEVRFRMPGFPLLPILFVAFAVVFVAYTGWGSAQKVGTALQELPTKGRQALAGLYPLFTTLVILAGIPLYVYFRRRAGAPQSSE